MLWLPYNYIDEIKSKYIYQLSKIKLINRNVFNAHVFIYKTAST